jgi:hypothetical protein
MGDMKANEQLCSSWATVAVMVALAGCCLVERVDATFASTPRTSGGVTARISSACWARTPPTAGMDLKAILAAEETGQESGVG